MGLVAKARWDLARSSRRDANFQPAAPECVVCVTPDEIDEVIGARSVAERTRFLRRQRAAGRMHCRKGQLTSQLARRPGLTDAKRRVYCFRVGSPEDPLSRWFNETFDLDPEGLVPSDWVRKSYTDYCAATGGHPRPSDGTS